MRKVEKMNSITKSKSQIIKKILYTSLDKKFHQLGK